MLSGGGSLARRSRYGRVESPDRKRSLNSLYFGDIYDTLDGEVTRNETTEMVWKEDHVVDGQGFVGYVQNSCDNTATL